MEATQRLISQWTQPKPDEYVDSVAEVLGNFSLEIVEKCVSPLRGISRTKLNGEPRRFPPAIPEILAFCESTVREDFRASPSAPPIAPARPPPTEEERARVQSKLEEAKASLTRAMGRKSPEDELTEAQKILERCERQAKDAALAAAKARQAPPSDGAHAGRAYADLDARRRSPFDDPDM